MYIRGVWALSVLAMVPLFTHAQVGLNVDVEDAVRSAFAETPIMIEIARCESKFRQHTDSGNPLYGGYQGRMVGVFQIYSDVHASYARGIGMDIETLDGNLAYAKHLYDREGTTPWLSSFPCWGSSVDSQTNSDESGAITMNLSLGMEHPQVLLLQRLLNEKGFRIAENGPGSPGEETRKFGAFTRAAVQKFQCAQMQICDGNEYTTGHGFVGAKTRAALASRTVAPPPPVSVTASGYTSEQQAEIERLQKQIAELTAVLQRLLEAS